MGQIIEKMNRLGIDRGLFAGSRVWLFVGTIAWTVKAVRWVSNREKPVVFQGMINPGDRLLITATNPVQKSHRRSKRRRVHH